MKLTVLVDNAPDDANKLKAEHGLSFHIQENEKTILIDVGATSLFAENACKMGISIEETDYLILSHAHADHTGGLTTFLAINDKAKIYLSSNICGRHCFSTRGGSKRDISIEHKLLQRHKERFIFVDKNTTITDNIALICEIPSIYPEPTANKTLLANDALDDFSHELAVVVRSNKGTATLISPCSHRGILNILDAVKDLNITNFIGGLHLLDSNSKHLFESEDEVNSLAHEISKRDISLYTGHCTGTTAKEILSKELESRYTEFHSGFSISLRE